MQECVYKKYIGDTATVKQFIQILQATISKMGGLIKCFWICYASVTFLTGIFKEYNNKHLFTHFSFGHTVIPFKKNTDVHPAFKCVTHTSKQILFFFNK